MNVEAVKAEESEIKRGLDALRAEFCLTRPYFSDWINSLTSEIGTSRPLFKIIIDNNVEVGWLLVNTGVGNHCAKLSALVIYSQFRGRGIGSHALAKVIDTISTSVDFIFTQCRADNDAAISLVSELGFRNIGILHHVLESADNLIFAYSTTDNSVSSDDMVKMAIEIYEQHEEQFISTGGQNG